MRRLFYISFITIVISISAQAQFERYLEDTEVIDIASDGSNIWFATNGKGLFKYSLLQDEWTNYNSENGLQNDFIYCVTANARYVWAGSIDGLFIFDQRTNRWFKRKFSKGGQLSNWIRSIAYDSEQDVVWIGRFMYLTKFDIDTRRFTDYDLTINRDEKTNTIKTIALDADSLVWFGTEDGLHKYNKFMDMNEPGALTYYDNRLNFFKGEGEKVSVSDLLFERNYIWIGLDEFVTEEQPTYNVGGLFRYDRKNEWRKFDRISGFDGNGVYSIEATGNYLWVSLYEFSMNAKAEYGRGVAIINKLNNKVQMLNSEEIPNKVYSIYFDGENMWFGSSEGVVRINLVNQFAQWGDYK